MRSQVISALIAMSLVVTASAQAQTQTQTAKVYAVLDGDTIKAVIDGNRVTIHLIGINAPEANPPQCFSREAAQRMRKAVLNKTVTLEADKVAVDRYGRLLRYVFLEDGRMVNEVLLQSGLAVSETYGANTHYADKLGAAEATAKAHSLGVWGKCGGVAKQAAATPTKIAPAPAPTIAVVAGNGNANNLIEPGQDKYPCPADKPVKGNINSKHEHIYHVRGNQAYNRTKPEQCFATAAEASAAGFRAALK